MRVLNKLFIEKFNKNKNKDEYREILNEYFPKNSKCRNCNDVIYYYDSTFSISKGILITKNKSYNMIKTLDNDYHLSICEDCLSKKYPEYQNKNKSRVFNQMNYITEYAFDINHNVALIWMKEKYAITKDNLIRKWGEEIGEDKWNEYCEKQRYSNTFEYKNKKHGWSKDKFNDYNKSRSVTLDNLILRHGEESGLKIWNEYCEKQRYSTSIEYFIGKYGNEIGKNKFDNFCKKRIINTPYSMVSKKLFDELCKKIDKKYTIYYGENEWFSYDNLNKKYYLIDFYIRELNFGIEFNGDYWHANPKKYSPTDRPLSFRNQITAQEIWDNDKTKIDYLKTKIDKLLIIWEDELNKDGIEKTIDRIIKEING